MATIGDIVTINAEQQADHEARKIRKREQKIEQKRRERERKAAERLARDIAEAEYNRVQAIEIERHDERMAPAVLRGAIVTSDGRMLRGPVIRIVAGRPMIGAEFPFAPERSRRAACMLRLDWQEVGAGLNAGAVDYLRAGGSGSGDGAHTAMGAQIDTRRRLDSALASLGWREAVAVARTVLDCIPIPIWVREENGWRIAKGLDSLGPEEAVQFIAAALRLLADFYWPPKPESAKKQPFLTIGPAREAYRMGDDGHGEEFDDRGRLITV